MQYPLNGIYSITEFERLKLWYSILLTYNFKNDLHTWKNAMVKSETLRGDDYVMSYSNCDVIKQNELELAKSDFEI